MTRTHVQNVPPLSPQRARRTPSRGRSLVRLGSLVLLLSGIQTACSSENGDDVQTGDGTGGASGTGGAIGSGGDGTTSGTGGVVDTSAGGIPSTGAGGLLGAGGTPGAGGNQFGSGGSDGTGGVDGTGGGSGGDGTGGDDGTGGAVGFQPCPSTGPCKILPLGDSITVGYPNSDSYRVHLFELAVADGHDITFVGTKMGGPATVSGMTFPRNHEGVSGETVAQIANRVPSPGLDDMPHIVLLHAGTNDLTGNNAQVTNNMASLLDELISDAPDALIVVARVIPIFYMLSGVESYNDSVEALAQERANAGAHIIVVDHFDGFPESELGDTVHPNATGYAHMAQNWYDGIEEYLP